LVAFSIIRLSTYSDAPNSVSTTQQQAPLPFDILAAPSQFQRTVDTVTVTGGASTYSSQPRQSSSGTTTSNSGGVFTPSEQTAVFRSNNPLLITQPVNSATIQTTTTSTTTTTTTTTQPTTTTTAVPIKMEPLQWNAGLTPILVKLPDDRKISQLDWLAVWHHGKQVRWGISQISFNKKIILKKLKFAAPARLRAYPEYKGVRRSPTGKGEGPSVDWLPGRLLWSHRNHRHKNNSNQQLHVRR
jgi:hypothetical protein